MMLGAEVLRTSAPCSFAEKLLRGIFNMWLQAQRKWSKI